LGGTDQNPGLARQGLFLPTALTAPRRLGSYGKNRPALRVKPVKPVAREAEGRPQALTLDSPFERHDGEFRGLPTSEFFAIVEVDNCRSVQAFLWRDAIVDGINNRRKQKVRESAAGYSCC